MVSQVDFQKAKDYIASMTHDIATELLPKNVENLEVRFENLNPGANNPGMVDAESYSSKNMRHVGIAYDAKLIKANMYNTRSDYFRGLAIHELCHAVVDIELGTKEHKDHDRTFYNCVSQYNPDFYWMGHADSHPARNDLRAYHGSDDLVVPQYILDKMVLFKCEDCGEMYLHNMLATKGKLPMFEVCEGCHGSEIRWQRVDPENVYRIALANNVREVRYAKPVRIYEIL
jgi:predicted SprT family Zn-dependent metalloprotease